MSKKLQIRTMSAILIACVSTAYYFALFLPKHMTDKETHRRAIECRVSCEDYERKLTPGDVAFYTEYHYNPQLDKCFLYVLSASSDSKGRFTEETIYDVNENTAVASDQRNENIPTTDFSRRRRRAFDDEKIKLFEKKQTNQLIKWIRVRYKKFSYPIAQETKNRTA